MGTGKGSRQYSNAVQRYGRSDSRSYFAQQAIEFFESGRLDLARVDLKLGEIAKDRSSVGSGLWPELDQITRLQKCV